MRHLMLDIETFGTTPGCVVLSIGAVEFDLNGIKGEFHAHIDVDSSTTLGLKVDAHTVMWWLDQSKEAQNALLQADTFPIQDVLDAFSDTFEWKDLKIWANGASFDFPILEAVYKAAHRNVPWKYYNQMDFRTMKNLVPNNSYELLRVRPGTAHNALDDARAQAATLINIINWTNGTHYEQRITA